MLLAIDTASQFMSLALHDGRQIWYEATWRTPNNHTVELSPAIQAALAHVGRTVEALSAVAVAQGPGSFTGLRIGMGVAKGLALAQDLLLVAVPTLEIVAAGVPWGGETLVAVVQAGRGRVSAQPFRWARDTWTPAGDAAIFTWEALIETVEHETLFAGEIDEHGHALLDATDRPVRIAQAAYSLRRAGMLAEIAWDRVDVGDTDDPAAVTPIYLKQPGAS